MMASTFGRDYGCFPSSFFGGIINVVGAGGRILVSFRVTAGRGGCRGDGRVENVSPVRFNAVSLIRLVVFVHRPRFVFRDVFLVGPPFRRRSDVFALIAVAQHDVGKRRLRRQTRRRLFEIDDAAIDIDGADAVFALVERGGESSVGALSSLTSGGRRSRRCRRRHEKRGLRVGSDVGKRRGHR